MPLHKFTPQEGKTLEEIIEEYVKTFPTAVKERFYRFDKIEKRSEKVEHFNTAAEARRIEFEIIEAEDPL